MRVIRFAVLFSGLAALAFSQTTGPALTLTPNQYTQGYDVQVRIVSSGMILTPSTQVYFLFTWPQATAPVLLQTVNWKDSTEMTVAIPAGALDQLGLLTQAATGWIRIGTQDTLFTVNPHLRVLSTTLASVRENYWLGYSQYIYTTGTGTGTRLVTSNGTGQMPPGLTLATDGSGLVSGSPTTAGTYTFGVTITDLIETIQPNITIRVDPQVTITTSDPLPDAVVNTAYSANLTQQYGISPCTWSAAPRTALPQWLSLSSGGALTGTPSVFDLGTNVLMVQVQCAAAGGSTGASEVATKTLTLPVTAPVLSILSTSPLPRGKVGTAYSFQFQATGGLPPYNWASSGTLPPGLTFNNSGALAGTPTASGSYSFTVQVSDTPPTVLGAAAERHLVSRGPANTRGRRQASTGVTFTVQIDPDITPLTLWAPSDPPAGTVGAPYLYWVQAMGGRQPYTWSSGGTLPPGITLDASAGKLSGTPTEPGTYSFQLSVRDDSSQTASRDFSITIATLPLGVTTAALPSGTVGTAYSQSLTASGGAQPYTWAIASGALPAGLTLNASTGLISGTPNASGPANFTVRVTDRLSSPATADLSISVQPATLVLAPVTPDQGVVGTAYSLALSASGGVRPYTWSITVGALPPGLAIDSVTGAVSGTPTTRGSYDFTVQVKCSAGQIATAALTVRVAPPPLAITPAAPLPAGTIQQPYSATLSATGGVPDYTWSVSAGSLPTGLTLSASGAITGTPVATGTSNLTVQVRDTAQVVATLATTIVINPPPIAFATDTLPAGTLGVAYSQSISASGGTPPYTFSVSEGTLPAGISLNAATGALTGTPSSGGATSFTIKVADSTPGTQISATRPYSLTVNLPAAANPGFTGLNDTMNAAQQASFAVALASAYPLALDGTLSLSFAPETGLPDDPAIAFLSGGRTLGFTVPAGQTQGTFAASSAGLQTGTVAGVITITARFQQGGTDVTPSPAPARTIRIPRAVPGISSVKATRVSGGLQIEIFGYSTPRDLTQARFRFTAAAGSALQGADFTVQLSQVFATWYRDTASNQFGSSFRYLQPFTVQGDTSAVASVEVTLTSSAGDSQPVTANFQ